MLLGRLIFLCGLFSERTSHIYSKHDAENPNLKHIYYIYPIQSSEGPCGYVWVRKTKIGHGWVPGRHLGVELDKGSITLCNTWDGYAEGLLQVGDSYCSGRYINNR